MSNVYVSGVSKTKLIISSGIALAILFAMSLMFSEQASAHGYVTNSRAKLCNTKVNTNCGQIMYEPNNLEHPKGFPGGGPADGKIASAGDSRYAPLDEQTSTRWVKNSIKPGLNTFNWELSAAHKTSSWKYYITKQDWNPNAPLTRDSFDLTPFCEVPYSGQPPKNYSDTCNVPNRTGYQVILAYWEIADTVNAFYNVIDVDFGGGSSDNVAPTAPAGAAASNVAATTATISWNAASDNVGVTGYQVYQGATLVGTVSGSTLQYNVTGLTGNTAYAFTVKAVDGAGNVSAASNVVNVTTLEGTAYPTWSATSVYLGGAKVTHNGLNYEAKWWTQGENPSTATSGVWKLIP